MSKPTIQKRSATTQEIEALNHHIFEGNKERISQMLSENIHFDLNNISDKFGNPPILSAIYQNNYQLAQLLLKHGAKPHLKDEDGVTALQHAVSLGFLSIAGLLISDDPEKNKLNINLNVILFNGETPLITAARNNDAKMVSLFLDHNADPTITNKHGENAIDTAIAEGHLDIARLCIRKLTSTPELKDTASTLLMMSISKGKKDVVTMLLEEKVNPNFVNQFNSSPLSVALHSVKHLLNANNKSNAYLHIQKELNDHGVYHEPESTPKALLLKNAIYNNYTQKIEANLKLSNNEKMRNALDIITLLFQHQTDPDIPDQHGATVLSKFANLKDDYLVELLIGNGANTNVPHLTEEGSQTIIDSLAKLQNDTPQHSSICATQITQEVLPNQKSIP